MIFFHAIVDLAVELFQGLPWFASSQVLTKIGNNLAIGATVMHVVLWYGKDIIEVIKKYKVVNPSIPSLQFSDSAPRTAKVTIPTWRR